MQEMKRFRLDIKAEGDLSDFLGVDINHLPDGSYHLSQPASELQTEIALSSTKLELTGLSHAPRSAIPRMHLMTELKQNGFLVPNVCPKVHCKVFEDNSGAIEIARVPKIRPRTKHLNVKLHHFRDYVERSEITIHAISTHDQLADMLTKPVPQPVLDRHRLLMMGW
jgi:hypothetical protein